MRRCRPDLGAVPNRRVHAPITGARHGAAGLPARRAGVTARAAAVSDTRRRGTLRLDYEPEPLPSVVR